MSQSLPLHTAVTRLCRKRNKNITVLSFIYRGSQSHCSPGKQWFYTVLTVGKIHTQKTEDDCMNLVT